jgi:hypothetical protein
MALFNNNYQFYEAAYGTSKGVKMRLYEKYLNRLVISKEVFKTMKDFLMDTATDNPDPNSTIFSYIEASGTQRDQR